MVKKQPPRGLNIFGELSKPPSKSIVRRAADCSIDSDAPVAHAGDAERVCWVCLGSGGKAGRCPECAGTGRNPRRPSRPDRVLFTTPFQAGAGSALAWLSYQGMDDDEARDLLQDLGVIVPAMPADRSVLRKCIISIAALSGLHTYSDIFSWGPDAD